MRQGIRRLLALVLLCCALSLCGCDWFVSADQRIARAEKRLADSDERGALIELQNAVRSEPANVRARLMLAKISLQMGDAKAARKELDEAAAHGATADQTAELSAGIFLAQNEAAELLSRIDTGKLVLPPPQRALYRGLALLATNQRDSAIESFNEAVKLDPQLSRAHVGLAEAFAAANDSDAALRELDDALKQNDRDAEVWLLRGTILVRRGEFRQATESLQSAKRHAAGQLSAPQHSMLLAALTETQLASGDKAAAQVTQAELAGRAPDAAVTQLLAARLAMANQDYAAAVDAARKAVKAAPTFTPAKMLLGAALLAQGSLNQAEVELADVVHAAPENLEARKLLAQVNLRLQRPDVAMQVLAPAQQGDSNDPQLDALLGWASLQRGDQISGIALLEKSVAANPNDSNLKIDLATAYISAGRNEDAARLLQSLPATAGGERRSALLVSAIEASRGAAAAAAELDKLRAAAPSDLTLLNLGAAFHAHHRDFSRAREWIERAIAVDPKRVATLINSARVELAAGDNAAAKRELQQASAVDPSDKVAKFALVEIALREGDIDAATRLLEQMRKADPKAAEPRLALARLYMQQKKSHEAEEVVREIQAQGEVTAATQNALGRLYLDAGRFDEALNFLRSAAGQDAGNAAYAMDVAKAQLALGNTQSARETLQKSSQAHPESIAAVATLIMLDLREGRHDDAVARLEALKQAHPGDAAVTLLEGDVALSSKSFEAAAAAYETAYRQKPSATAALRLYRARDLAKIAEPQRSLEDWLQKHPDDVSVRMVLAEAHLANGHQQQAISQYEILAKRDQPNPMALNNLAWLYHQTGDARARDVAQRAYRAAPTIAAIADTYGWILVAQGNLDEALPILQKAASAEKAVPDIKYHYAVALARAGRREEARGVLASITGSGIDSPTVAAARKLLAELEG